MYMHVHVHCIYIVYGGRLIRNTECCVGLSPTWGSLTFYRKKAVLSQCSALKSISTAFRLCVECHVYQYNGNNELLYVVSVCLSRSMSVREGGLH